MKLQIYLRWRPQNDSFLFDLPELFDCQIPLKELLHELSTFLLPSDISNQVFYPRPLFSRNVVLVKALLEHGHILRLGSARCRVKAYEMLTKSESRHVHGKPLSSRQFHPQCEGASPNRTSHS